MRSILILLVTGFISIQSFSQNVPRFQKVAIMNTGCSAYFPGKPDNFDLSFSEDSSEVITGSIDYEGYIFGVIAVKFKNELEGTHQEVEDLLVAYLDYLKTFFGISDAIGYGKGHTMESNKRAQGVIDFWVDSEENQYSIKGWIDYKYLGFMYIKGKKEYPNYNVVTVFLNGFVFGK